MRFMLSHMPDSLPLRDIHLPPSPSWWPPAPGWWILFAVLCATAVVAYLIYRTRRRAQRWRAHVLRELKQSNEHHAADDAAYAAAVHQLLRRVARRYAPDALHLQGEPWRSVLAQVSVDTATLDTLMTLETRMYHPRAKFDRIAVEQAAQRWLQAAWSRVKSMEPTHA